MKNKDLLRKCCYELYKNNWFREHVTKYADDDIVADYYHDMCLEEPEDRCSLKDYIQEGGYNGEMYACYKEFLQNEYLDIEYMEPILEDYKQLWADYKDDLMKTLRLPKSIKFKYSQVSKMSQDELENFIAEHLSARYGYCHYGFEVKIVKEEDAVYVTNIEWDVSQ